jgi:hypothetical protein
MRRSILLFLALGGCGPSPSDKQIWSGPWQEPTGDVIRALAAKNVQGCGDFFEKESATLHGDFAVACSELPDGSGRLYWTGYEVFTETGEVLGPDLSTVDTKFGGPPRPWTSEERQEMNPRWRHTRKSKRG